MKLERVCRQPTSTRERKRREQAIQDAVDWIVVMMDELEDPFDVATALAQSLREVQGFTGVGNAEIQRAALVLSAKANPGN
jgi:hypothetical protein